MRFQVFRMVRIQQKIPSVASPIGGEPPNVVESVPDVPVDVAPDVDQDAVVAPAGVKRKAEESSGETPDAKTIILDDPSLPYASQDVGGHAVAELHPVLEDVGLQFGLDAERTTDGWHGPLPDGSHAYLSSFVCRTPVGKRLSEVSCLTVTTAVQSEPGAGWEVLEVARNRHWAMATLDNIAYRTLSLYHPCSHHVCSAAHSASREPEQEFSLADSSDDDATVCSDASTAASAKEVMRLVPRKLRKALDREIPWDLTRGRFSTNDSLDS